MLVRKFTRHERSDSGADEEDAHHETLELRVRGDAQIPSDVLERGVDDAEVISERERPERRDQHRREDAAHERLIVQNWRVGCVRVVPPGFEVRRGTREDVSAPRGAALHHAHGRIHAMIDGATVEATKTASARGRPVVLPDANA